jgi:predicted ribosomally synthesized peptide with nif11-like leader
MSKQVFKKFCSEIRHDDKLQIRLQQISDPFELIQVGQEKGFDFTVEDIVEGFRDLKDRKKKRDDFLKNTVPPALLGFDEADIDDVGVLGLDYFSEDILNLAIY